MPSESSMNKLNRFFQWGFEILMIGAAALVVESLRDVSKSISELNAKVGVVLERTDNQSKQIEKTQVMVDGLEARVRNLEIKAK